MPLPVYRQRVMMTCVHWIMQHHDGLTSCTATRLRWTSSGPMKLPRCCDGNLEIKTGVLMCQLSCLGWHATTMCSDSSRVCSVVIAATACQTSLSLYTKAFRTSTEAPLKVVNCSAAQRQSVHYRRVNFRTNRMLLWDNDDGHEARGLSHDWTWLTHELTRIETVHKPTQFMGSMNSQTK